MPGQGPAVEAPNPGTTKSTWVCGPMEERQRDQGMERDPGVAGRYLSGQAMLWDAP